MTDIESPWKMAEHVESRLKKPMEGVGSFQDIVERIRDEANVTWFDVCPGNKYGNAKELEDCIRPELKLKVQAETFDLFFNSPYGYRAQYLKNPEEGLEQNGRLINRLSKKLLEYAKDKKTKIPMNKERIKKSLNCSSARVWISEEGPRSTSKLINLVEEIQVSEWLKHAREAKTAFANSQYPSPLEQKKAIEGIKAPEGTVLVVIGAFLDDDGEEVVHPDKIHRRFEIQRYGFT